MKGYETMKTITSEKLAELQREAAEKPRRRTNLNLHEQLDDPIQRLCVTGEPDTVFPVHRHLGKWELVTIIKGSTTLYIYDDNGSITEQLELAPGGDTIIVEIPQGVWHNYILHESGTTFFEVKHGPYKPFAPEELASFKGMTPDGK